MTTAIDSATPNSHPRSYITATTEITMSAMQRMVKIEIRIFIVEIVRTKKANNIEMMIPILAVLINSSSVLIQVNHLPPVIIPLLMPLPEPLFIVSVRSLQPS